MFTLEELDVSNNETLTMVPPRWRGDTDSVIFVCTVHRDYQVKMEEMLRTNADLTKHSQFLEQEQLRLMENNVQIKFQLTELKKQIPDKVRACVRASCISPRLTTLYIYTQAPPR
jgi:hypothetical protein